MPRKKGSYLRTNQFQSVPPDVAVDQYMRNNILLYCACMDDDGVADDITF